MPFRNKKNLPLGFNTEDVRIKEVVEQLTLEEKAALCSGIDFWHTTPIPRMGIPPIMMADGPHGLRVESVESKIGNVMQESVPATCFPPAVTLACTWDKKLASRVGAAIADEAKEQGVSTFLGPGVNIKRSPLCGRNFEYFSEDPYLSGEMAAAYINGAQETGVGTSLKHFAVNSQEHRRMVCSSEVDERTVREIYLTAFEIAVKKARPQTVMCSYNPINGVHASDNKRLLWDILREEWGYCGLVVSDWGAVNDRVAGIAAGLDLEMPGCNGINDKKIIAAIKDGTLSMEKLNQTVERILEYVLSCADRLSARIGHRANYARNHTLARKVAASGSVLLKNDGGILPLNSSADFLVVGQLAKKPRYQGSGSSQINPKRLESFCDYLKNHDIKFDYAPGYSDSMITFRDLIEAAAKKAVDKDYVLVFAGLTATEESEGFDRHDLKLSDAHNDLIDAIAEVNKNVVVVLAGGSPVEMPWLDKVKGVVNVYLGGEATGGAVYDVVFGAVNPSGKLAETYPLKLDDLLASKYYPMGPNAVEYREGIYVGYRYYDKAKKDVLFPFGYGLSYTTFEYSNMKVSADKTDLAENITVSVDITNTGKVNGAEVVQLYVRDVESTVFMPEKELKGFEKIFLEVGETKTVSFELNKRAFAFYNTAVKDWTVEAGDFEILIGASSRDIRQKAVLSVETEKTEMPDYRAICPIYYDLEGVDAIPDEQFTALTGRPLADNTPRKQGELDFNSTVADCGVNLFGRTFQKIFLLGAKKSIPKNAPPAQAKMIKEGALAMPVRNFYAMSVGVVPYETCIGILMALNGHTLKGLFHALKAFIFRNKYGNKKKQFDYK